MSRSLVLIGYLPKQFTEATGDIDAPAYAGVEEICSVSECFAKSPPDWVDKWVHNTETWLFDTPEAAWSVVPAAERERYRLYAYRLLPTLFHESGQETEHPLPELTTVPIPDGGSRVWGTTPSCATLVGATMEAGLWCRASATRRCHATTW